MAILMFGGHLGRHLENYGFPDVGFWGTFSMLFLISNTTKNRWKTFCSNLLGVRVFFPVNWLVYVLYFPKTRQGRLLGHLFLFLFHGHPNLFFPRNARTYTYVSVPDSPRVRHSSSLPMTESVNSSDQSGSAVVAKGEGSWISIFGAHYCDFAGRSIATHWQFSRRFSRKFILHRFHFSSLITLYCSRIYRRTRMMFTSLESLGNADSNEINN